MMLQYCVMSYHLMTYVMSCHGIWADDITVLCHVVRPDDITELYHIVWKYRRVVRPVDVTVLSRLLQTNLLSVIFYQHIFMRLHVLFFLPFLLCFLNNVSIFIVHTVSDLYSYFCNSLLFYKLQSAALSSVSLSVNSSYTITVVCIHRLQHSRLPNPVFCHYSLLS